MKYRIIIYSIRYGYIVEDLDFDDPREVEDLLETYEGYPAKLLNTDTNETLIEGAFDDTFFDEYYYE